MLDLMNEKDVFDCLPPLCQECPLDVDLMDRDYCWCRYFVDDFAIMELLNQKGYHEIEIK